MLTNRGNLHRSSRRSRSRRSRSSRSCSRSRSCCSCSRSRSSRSRSRSIIIAVGTTGGRYQRQCERYNQYLRRPSHCWIPLFHSGSFGLTVRP
jgi:hypothetical protein